MRPDLIVLLEPLVDDGLSLTCCAKPFSVQKFPAESAVEALIVSVLPGRPRIDADRFDAYLGQPVRSAYGQETSSRLLNGGVNLKAKA